MPEVKSRKIVFVRASLDDTGSFTYNIHIPFHVDDMILTSWTCGRTTAGAIPHPFILTMQGIGEILCFTEQDFDSPRHIFNINSPIIGQQTFDIRNAAGTIVDQTGCQFAFSLEFIEFHR